MNKLGAWALNCCINGRAFWIIYFFVWIDVRPERAKSHEQKQFRIFIHETMRGGWLFLACYGTQTCVCVPKSTDMCFVSQGAHTCVCVPKEHRTRVLCSKEHRHVFVLQVAQTCALCSKEPCCQHHRIKTLQSH